MEANKDDRLLTARNNAEEDEKMLDQPPKPKENPPKEAADAKNNEEEEKKEGWVEYLTGGRLKLVAQEEDKKKESEKEEAPKKPEKPEKPEKSSDYCHVVDCYKPGTTVCQWTNSCLFFRKGGCGRRYCKEHDYESAIKAKNQPPI